MAPPKKPWFRFYVEAIWDRKIRRQHVATRWVFVTALACARSSPVPGTLLLEEGAPMTLDDLTDAAALPRRQVKSGIEALIDIGIVRKDDDTWVISKWNGRQFESDRRSDGGSIEQPNDGDTTPPETEADTETEEDSPNPAKRGRGSPRQTGTSPRQQGWQREIDRLTADLAACEDCGDSETRFCSRCDVKRRRVGVLETKIRDLAS